MTTPRDRAVDDLLASCRDLKTDPDAARLRVIEGLEELDRLDAVPPPRVEPPVIPPRRPPRQRHYGPEYTWTQAPLMSADTLKLRKILWVATGCCASFLLLVMLIGAFILSAHH